MWTASQMFSKPHKCLLCWSDNFVGRHLCFVSRPDNVNINFLKEDTCFQSASTCNDVMTSMRHKSSSMENGRSRSTARCAQPIREQQLRGHQAMNGDSIDEQKSIHSHGHTYGFVRIMQKAISAFPTSHLCAVDCNKRQMCIGSTV